MSWDDEHAYDREQNTAQDLGGALRRAIVRTLENGGHAACEYLEKARIDPASGMVVCGCGVFEMWQQQNDRGPDNPPWSPADGDYANAGQEPAAPPAVRPGGTIAYEAQDPIRSTLDLIDPSQVYTPEDVERHILDTLWRLETGQLAERQSVEQYYAAKQAFDRKFFAQTIVHQDLRTDQCKAQSMVDCEDEYAKMLTAEMVAKAIKATMHNLRSVLSGYQSTARSVGSAYQAGGSQGGPPQRDRSPW